MNEPLKPQGQIQTNMGLIQVAMALIADSARSSPAIPSIAERVELLFGEKMSYFYIGANLERLMNAGLVSQSERERIIVWVATPELEDFIRAESYRISNIFSHGSVIVADAVERRKVGILE